MIEFILVAIFFAAIIVLLDWDGGELQRLQVGQALHRANLSHCTLNVIIAESKANRAKARLARNKAELRALRARRS